MKPCACGGQGRGFNGFHYPGADGCLSLPDVSLPRLLELRREKLVELDDIDRELERRGSKPCEQRL